MSPLFIPCQRKYVAAYDQCGTQWEGLVEPDIITVDFLHSDWLYFPWHDIQAIIIFQLTSNCQRGMKSALSRTLSNIFCSSGEINALSTFRGEIYYSYF